MCVYCGVEEAWGHRQICGMWREAWCHRQISTVRGGGLVATNKYVYVCCEVGLGATHKCVCMCVCCGVGEARGHRQICAVGGGCHR